MFKKHLTTIWNSTFRILELLTWTAIFYVFPSKYGIELYGLQVTYLTYASFTIAFATGTNTAIIKYVLDGQNTSLKALGASLVIYSFIASTILALYGLPFTAVVFVLASIWRNYIYALRRSEHKVKLISKISSVINILAVMVLLLTNISFFSLLLSVRFLEILATYRKKDFQFSFSSVLYFFRGQGNRIVALIIPGLAMSLDKLVATTVYNSSELGIYQIIDQTNVGGYALIMTVIYVELPRILEYIKKGKMLPSYFKLALLLPVLLFLFNTLICIIFFDLKFDNIKSILLINSLYKFIIFSSSLLATIRLHRSDLKTGSLNLIVFLGLVSFGFSVLTITVLLWILSVFIIILKFSSSFEFSDS